VNLQRDLLQEATYLVKEGGSIVYSTCSLFDDENASIIDSFIEKNNDFYLEKTLPLIGRYRQIQHGVVQEVFPHLHKTEGFFIAKIKRNN
jgi:16S rRNA (cytosine967-C5)-methyltransferase